MSIYVIATYDLAGSRAAPPELVARLEAEGTELVSIGPGRAPRSAEKGGVTLVLEFASREAARTWAGEPEWSSVRQAWLHPAGEAPRFQAEDLAAL